MKVQRWIGLIAAAVVLHTNARAAFAACIVADSGAATADATQHHPASHGERIPGAGPGSTHHHEESLVLEEMASVTDEGSVPSESSGSEDCCQEMTSCGSYMLANQRAVRNARGIAAAAANSRHSEVLLGRTAEPEPPPPKA